MWNLPPLYIYIGVCITIKTGIQVIYTWKLGGLSASYPYMFCTRSRQISDFMYQYARHLCWIDGGSICLWYLYVFYMHWYFLIFSYKLTVSNGLSLVTLNSEEFTQWSGSFKWGVHLPLVSTCLYMHWYFLIYFLLVDCFKWALIDDIEQWRDHSVLWQFWLGGGRGGSDLPPRGKSGNFSSFQVLLLLHRALSFL